MSILKLNTLFTDPLNGANQQPLNPANWAVDNPDVFGDPSCQILNHECCADSSAQYGVNYLIGATLPQDQWCSVQVDNFDHTTFNQLQLALRVNTDFYLLGDLATPRCVAYVWSAISQLDGEGNSEGIYCLKYVWTGSSLKITQLGGWAGRISNGAEFKVAAVGAGPVNLYCWVAGILVLNLVDNNMDGGGYAASGSSYISPVFAVDVTGIQFTEFQAGSVTNASIPGFAPSWLSGQNNAELGIYISSGEVNGVTFDGGQFFVLPNSTTLFWVDYLGNIRLGLSIPGDSFPIARVVSGPIITGSNGETSQGILSITDLRN
jgi:hypothetical protein